MRILLLICLLPSVVLAQRKAGYYSGFLKSANGTPIINATITNSNNGDRTWSGNEGFYEIEASGGDTLIIKISTNNQIVVPVSDERIYPSPLRYQPAIFNPVQPVRSNVYLEKVNTVSVQSLKNWLNDSLSPSTAKSHKLKRSINPNGSYVKMRSGDGIIYLKPLKTRFVMIRGSYTMTLSVKQANQESDLQQTFAQGRPVNGQLQWQGPETGELFSFGPALSSLAYDGIKYDYDENGRLVPVATGNGVAAKPYHNTIFRKGMYFSQLLSLMGQNGNYHARKSFSLRIMKSHENLVMQKNENEKTMLAWTGKLTIYNLEINAGYERTTESFSVSNRNGFLNYIYGQSLITPASFSNTQGSYLGNGQRSFSALADNPFYLLDDPAGYSRMKHNQVTLRMNERFGTVNVYLNQSFETAADNMVESYRNGSAVAETGVNRFRKTSSGNYVLMTGASKRIEYGSSRFQSTALVNYVFSDLHHQIHAETFPAYKRQRSSHDISFSYQTVYPWRYFEAGVNVIQKIYLSNTSSKKYLFLPAVNSYLRFVPESGRWIFRAAASVNTTRQEISTAQSFAGAGWLNYRAAETGAFIPQQEPASIHGLTAQQIRDGNLQFEVSYKGFFRFSAERIYKKTSQDVYALPMQDELVLMNLSSTRMRGTEISLFTSTEGGKKRAVNLRSGISFFKARAVVTNVKEGYEGKPIAGFSNIYKTLIKGQSPGVIMGSTWLRNAAGQQIIGADGFPLVSPTLAVIGDPTPDFTIKLNNNLTFKRFFLSADLEWRKGGDVWNGTNAVLDYYGRSAQSGALRNTTNYVFQGVTITGQPNTTPVQFLDPSKPVEQNRWTRYGITGVASDYISKADYVRLHAVNAGYTWKFRKKITELKLTAYAENILIWSKYKGADPERLLFDQAGTAGLDLFNLPSSRRTGIMITLQF